MKIAILGCGHIGSWLARAFTPGNHLVLCDTVAAKAAELAAGLKNTATLPDIAALQKFRPEMLINAVSLQNTITAFETALPHLGNNNCVLVDVASLKNGLPEFYAKSGRKFVSIHPMFGPTFTDLVTLKDENIIVITESNRAAARFWRGFFSRLGLRLFEYSFAAHDAMMAYSLTIPFVSSMVFAACVDATAVPGTTFARHIKIAKGLLGEDDHLLAEILFNPDSLNKIETITARLEYLKHIIKARDGEEIKKFFDRLRHNLKPQTCSAHNESTNTN